MDTEAQQIRDSLAESAKEVLTLLGDLAEIEKRINALKKNLEEIYGKVNGKLDETF